MIYKRVTRYFSIKYNWKGLVTDGLLMAMFLFNGIALAMLYNLSAGHHTPGVATSLNLLKGMDCSLLIAPVLLRLFPGFALKTTFISPYYPQGKLLVATLDLVAMGLCKTRNAVYLLFLLFFYGFSRGLPSGTLTTLLLLLAIGIITGESLVNALSWRIYLHTIILVLLFTVSLLGLRHYYGFDPAYMNSCLAAVLLVLTMLYFYFYEPGSAEDRLSSPAKANRVTSTARSGARSPYLLILTGNRPFLTVLAVGMFFKVLIIAAFIFTKGNSLDEVLDKAPFIVCIITPIILFSYVYNNLWGYFYPVAMNNLLSGSDTRRQIRIYLNFLLPALLLDLAITFATLLLGHMLETKIILSYLATTALCIPIGIISSFRKYFFVPSGLDFNRIRGKTSKIFSFSLLIPAMLLGFSYNGTLFFDLTIIAIMIIAITLFIYIYHNHRSLLNKLRLDFFN
ncbi:MAG TPA: hypothetical protein VG605_09330 [Puia sp.]|nr:hypothetical protein [Puia sp.]